MQWEIRHVWKSTTTITFMSYEDNRELCVGITQYTMESEQIQELTDYVSEFGLKFPSINLLNGDDKTVVGTE